MVLDRSDKRRIFKRITPLVAGAVERAHGPTSLQYPYRRDARTFYTNIARMIKKAEIAAPPYVQDSRKRDLWLAEFAYLDPFVVGVLNSVLQIDKNRAWTLTGGRNQVRRFAQVLDNVEDGEGWRYFCGRAALSFYRSDLGSVTEVGRDGAGGPLASLWNVDSTLCRLTGKRSEPLQYRDQTWKPDDFFRIVSMPNTDEKYNGLGFCAMSRVLELAKVMVGMVEHAQEKLATRAPKGFLTVYPMNRRRWNEEMRSADEETNNRNRRVYEMVRILFSEKHPLDLKLISLSQLPDGFELDVWAETMMTGVALCFGYDPGEFWTMKSGGFSRGAEARVQQQKATGKGEREFPLALQTKLQAELPDSVLFQFEERDDQGNLVRAELSKMRSEVMGNYYDPLNPDSSVLTKEEVRALLSEMGEIPAAWSEIEAEIETTDVGMERSRLRDQLEIRRAAEKYPAEPIVRFTWPDYKERVIFDRADEVLRHRNYPAAKVRATLYDSTKFDITDEDVDKAIEQARERVGDELAELLTATPAETEG